HEHHVADVELGAVDATHFDRQTDVRGDAHDVTPHDPLEDVVGRGRREELAVAHEEQVRGAALRYVAVLGQHDRLGEASFFGFALGEGRVHIRAGDLAAGRDGVVVDPAP